MPTYRIPVRALVYGRVDIQAADPRLALEQIKATDRFDASDFAEVDYSGLEPDGEPVEVKP